MLIVRCDWGSRSTRRTRCSRSARAAPRLTAVVVLPTPPFWLAIAIVFATRMAPSLTDARGDYHAVVEGRRRGGRRGNEPGDHRRPDPGGGARCGLGGLPARSGAAAPDRAVRARHAAGHPAQPLRLRGGRG